MDADVFWTSVDNNFDFNDQKRMDLKGCHFWTGIRLARNFAKRKLAFRKKAFMYSMCRIYINIHVISSCYCSFCSSSCFFLFVFVFLFFPFLLFLFLYSIFFFPLFFSLLLRLPRLIFLRATRSCPSDVLNLAVSLCAGHQGLPYGNCTSC